MSGIKTTLHFPPPMEARAERFLITFRLFPPHENTVRRYTVCTVLGQRKALVLAASIHEREHGRELVYDIVECKLLDGDSPMGQDIVDRMEW